MTLAEAVPSSEKATTTFDPAADRRARFAAGKALRRATPRDSLAGFEPAPRDPVAILHEADATRIPSLVPIRYARMAASPFAFLRGAAAVMASDLAGAPQAGIAIQACGDAHLMNFGAFDTPEGRVLFDINDFDETLPGADFTLDIKRLVASVAVAAQAAGWSAKKARAAAASTAEAYRTRMLALAQHSPLEVWHGAVVLTRALPEVVDPALAARLRTLVTQAESNLDKDDNFPHLAPGATSADWRNWKIADKPPTIYHLDPGSQIRFDVAGTFAAYRSSVAPEVRALLDRYRLVDHAMKVVGVGSVGTFCAIGLFASGDGAPLFLQVKEANISVLERVANASSWIGEPGRRVVEGQRMMQAASDLFLGWCVDPASNRHLYIRHLKNRRLGSIGELVETTSLLDYARLCGRTLARAHARSADPALLAGYMGKSGAFDDALATFAMTYADQTVKDYAALVAAYGSAPAPGRTSPRKA